ncbi:MAG: DJ-1 family protein [Kordiimonadales bacterium]|nr:MAG: DJ-1 family protein [Kordiimonadales bacterium]
MTKKILLLLADGFEPMEAAGFTDVLGWANLDGAVPLKTVSAALHDTIHATFAYRVQPEKLLKQIDASDFDALAIPGGMDRGGMHGGFYKDAYSGAFQQVIQDFNAAGKPVAAVCVASLALGAAGVLRGKRATVYHQVGGKRRAELEGFGAHFVDQPVVQDANIITSTGPGTAVEVAFSLLEKLTSKDNSDHVRRLMRQPTPAPNWYVTPQVNP